MRPTAYSSGVDDRVYKLYRQVVHELHRHSPNQNQSLNATFLNEQIQEIIELNKKLENQTSSIRTMAYYQQNYEKHLLTVSQVQKLGFDVASIVQKMYNTTTIDDNELFFVPDIEYLRRLGPLMNATSHRTLANYLSSNMVFVLGRHTTTAMIELLVTKLDSPEILPNICYEDTVSLMPELLGKMYIDLIANRSDEKNIHTFVKLLNESFYENLSENTWMDQRTTKEALAKLNAMKVNIAFPRWYTNTTLFETYTSLVSMKVS